MRERIVKELIEWGKSIALALLIFFVLNLFIGTTTVYSTSMYPTLVERDLLLLKKGTNVNRGDIISFESSLQLSEDDLEQLNVIQSLIASEGDQKHLIKRVIGLPGEALTIEGGHVYIDGAVLEEPYLSTTTSGDVSIEEIPEGQYFLMGDNRPVSMDSRHLGLIDGETIIGKAIFRLWPLNRIGSM